MEIATREENDAQNTAKSSKNNDEDNVENEVPLSETTKKTKRRYSYAGLSYDDEGKTEQLGLGRGYSCVFDQLTHGEDTRTFGLNNESDYTLAAMTRAYLTHSLNVDERGVRRRESGEIRERIRRHTVGGGFSEIDWEVTIELPHVMRRRIETVWNWHLSSGGDDESFGSAKLFCNF